MLLADLYDDTSNLTLEEKIELQKTTFHWYPYKRIMFEVLDDGTFRRECPPPYSSIDEFPQFFTRKFASWLDLLRQILFDLKLINERLN